MTRSCSFPRPRSDDHAALGIVVDLAVDFVFVGAQVALRVVVVVDSGLAGVEVGRWDPLRATVFALSGTPAGFLDEPVVGAAGQGQFVDLT
jgi:hypothetical protein